MSSEEFWHGMTEWLGWEEISGDRLVQAPALIKITDDTKLEVVDTRDGCQQEQVAQDFVWFWISSWMKTVQPFWANVWTSLLLKNKRGFLTFKWIFFTSVCANCPSSCHCASLWQLIPIYTQRSLTAFPPLGWTAPAVSASPPMSDAPNP